MNSLRLSLFLAAGLILAACDQIRMPGASSGTPVEAPAVEEEAPSIDDTSDEDDFSVEPGAELPVRPEAASAETVIDWEAARRDLASRPIESREGSFQIASGEAAPPVPVFLPSGPVAAQSGDVAIRFQPMNDGYYAFFPGDAYDIIVNGTNKVITAPGETVPARQESFRFQPTTTGAQISFARYGADYLVEFECKELTNGLPACITEDEAVAFAEELVISGTR